MPIYMQVLKRLFLRRVHRRKDVKPGQVRTVQPPLRCVPPCVACLYTCLYAILYTCQTHAYTQVCHPESPCSNATNAAVPTQQGYAEGRLTCFMSRCWEGALAYAPPIPRHTTPCHTMSLHLLPQATAEQSTAHHATPRHGMAHHTTVCDGHG